MSDLRVMDCPRGVTMMGRFVPVVDISDHDTLRDGDIYFSPIRRDWMACPRGVMGMKRGASGLDWQRRTRDWQGELQ